MNERLDSQRGALLLSAVVLIVVVGFLVTTIALISTTSSRGTANQIEKAESFYIAQSGLERGLYAISAPDIASRTACSAMTASASLKNVALNTGVFSLYGTQYGANATLSSAINSTTTTIPVSSVASMASSGRVMIGLEAVDYTATSTSIVTCGGALACLLNATRGAGGTMATSHSLGDAVGQYQCMIQSQGGVPVLSPTSSLRAKSTVQTSTTLSYGMAVGDNFQNTARLYQFNSAASPNAWSIFSGTGSLPNRDYNSVFAINYNDAWAVGESGSIIHFNGSTWTQFVDVGNDDLHGVSCLNDKDCWAVGENGTIYHYNGLVWLSASTGVPTNVDLAAINCMYKSATAYRCFAVGSRRNNDGRVYEYNSDGGLIWSLATSPGFALYGIGCSSVNNCWAVGGQSNNNGDLIHYTGSWGGSGVLTPQGPIYDVSCSSANDCWAVGRVGYVYHYDGSNWTGGTDIGNDLNGVTCLSARNCWAVGDAGRVYHYNGSSWSEFADLGNFSFRGIYFVGQNASSSNGLWQEI